MSSANDALFSALTKGNFTELSLDKLKLDNASLFESNLVGNKTLKKIVIQNSTFSEAAGNALAKFLETSTTLESFFVSNTQLKGSSPSSLAKAFEHSHVKIFNLNMVKLGVIPARLFAASLNMNKIVTSFTLFNCAIDGDGTGNREIDSGAIELCKAIKGGQKHLRVFDISGNDIHPDNKKIIFGMLPEIFKGDDICPIIGKSGQTMEEGIEELKRSRDEEINKITLFFAATCRPSTQNLYCALPDFITFRNRK